MKSSNHPIASVAEFRAKWAAQLLEQDPEDMRRMRLECAGLARAARMRPEEFLRHLARRQAEEVRS